MGFACLASVDPGFGRDFFGDVPELGRRLFKIGIGLFGSLHHLFRFIEAARFHKDPPRGVQCFGMIGLEFQRLLVRCSRAVIILVEFLNESELVVVFGIVRS